MKTLRGVLTGCGSICRAWLKPSAGFADAEIVGLVDLNQASAETVKAEFNLAGAATGTDLKAMLGKTDPDIVFDCTIPGAHVGVTLTALRHGCHVLGEKPMAESMADARKMVAAAAKVGKLYAVIQNRRYQDPIRRCQALIRGGGIGDLTTLNADFYIGAHFGGFRDVMPHVLLLDMAIHSFDQARFLSGADPVAVYAHDWNPAGSWYRHGASAVAVFEMTSGIVFTYRGSWCAEGLNTSWECDWRAVGSRGSVRWDGGEGLSAETVAKDDGFIRPQQAIPAPSLPPLALTGHAAIIREFLDCVRSGRTPQTVGSDNIKSLAMVHAAIASAEKHRRVQIPRTK
jgi:predicted dehydrogenase